MNKKIVGLVTIVLLMVMMTAGCGVKQIEEQPPQVNEPAPVTPSNAITELYPLTLNSYWKYQVNESDKVLIEEKVAFAEDNKAQLIITDEATVMTIVYEYGKEPEQLMAVNSREEFYEETSLLEEKPRFKNIILQGPVEKGHTWESDGLTYTVMDMEAEVDVPAGHFTNCVVIEAKDEPNKFQNIAYYCNGVGLVKEISQGDEYRQTKELAEYEVK